MSRYLVSLFSLVQFHSLRRRGQGDKVGSETERTRGLDKDGRSIPRPKLQ
jgi:hypothetical protein